MPRRGGGGYSYQGNNYQVDNYRGDYQDSYGDSGSYQDNYRGSYQGNSYGTSGPVQRRSQDNSYTTSGPVQRRSSSSTYVTGQNVKVTLSEKETSRRTESVTPNRYSVTDTTTTTKKVTYDYKPRK